MVTYVERRVRTKVTRSDGKLNAVEDGSHDLSIMRKAPGAELLSDMELDLCTRVPFLPYHYLAVKDALVRYASH